MHPPQAGGKAPWEPQIPRQSEVICVLSCPISWLCGFYPLYQKTRQQSLRVWDPRTPLVAFSVSVMTNHRFHSDPAEPLRRANMTMLSSPVRTSILTKPFAQNTANDLSPHITICLWTCIFHQTMASTSPGSNPPSLYLRP